MKTIKLFAIAAVALIALQSCKKGENDPFLSLKSRDARIVGNWELTTSYSEFRQGFTYDGVTTETVNSSVYENGIEIYKTDSYSDTSEYTSTLEINKDGSSLLRNVYPSEEETESGTWFWSNNTKKKTGIIINGDDYIIDRLAKDELILKEDYQSNYVNPDGSGSSYSRVSTITFTKKK